MYAPKFLLAIFTLFAGLWLVKGLCKGIEKYFAVRDFDPSLEGFLLSVVRIVLRVLVLVTVASMVGIEMTSFIAILGAAGFAVGLSLQGTLQNFAGGVILLVLRPFKVGDFIEAEGFKGKVKKIQIFSTVLKTADNKTIIIPNSPLATGSVVNYSTESTRRVDFTFGISYDDDIDKAKQILLELAESNSNIIQDPKPYVAVSELGDNSVSIILRVWTASSDYWSVFFYMQELVKKTFDKQGLSFPYPQNDVHLYRVNN